MSRELERNGDDLGNGEKSQRAVYVVEGSMSSLDD